MSWLMLLVDKSVGYLGLGDIRNSMDGTYHWCRQSLSYAMSGLALDISVQSRSASRTLGTQITQDYAGCLPGVQLALDHLHGVAC